MQQLQLDGVHAAAAKCDVTQRNEVEQLIAWTVDQYGSLDIMVANAGIVKGADFLETTEADWDDVLNVNLKGPFIVSLCCNSCNLLLLLLPTWIDFEQSAIEGSCMNPVEIQDIFSYRDIQIAFLLALIAYHWVDSSMQTASKGWLLHAWLPKCTFTDR